MYLCTTKTMKQEECASLLEQHGVRPTANRIVVVRELATAGRPLTLSEIEGRIASIDKSGVFRALTLFREHHLVHAIEDGCGAQRYELCHSHSHDGDDDLHVHFFCERCQRTYCLDAIPIPAVATPPGFTPTSANFIIKGVCPHCHV